MTAYTNEEGLRLEGPIQIRIEPSEGSAPGRADCHVEIVPGPPSVWAQLTTKEETIGIGRNRVLIGRSPETDVVVPHDDISRRHALLYRERGQAFVRDLSSANGTTIDGIRVGGEATPVSHGSVLGLAGHRYRFVEVSDA
jgi:pSer/pThr/pTyr-binding forkhead associated (FHA) protein